MKLTVRVVDAPLQAGGTAILLCDEDGEPLPSQMDVSISQRAAGVSTITVTLLINGDDIAFAG